MKNLKHIVLLLFSIWWAWAMNYVYQYIMIQNLSIEKYSDFASLISVINIIWVLSLACSLFLVKEISKNKENIRNIVSVSKIKLAIIGSLLYLIYVLCTPLIVIYLDIDYKLILLSGFSLLLLFASLYQWAFFQWTKKFHLYSTWQILSPLFKILTWGFMVYIWYGVYWAIWGFIASQIILFILWSFIVKKYCDKLPISSVNEKEIFQSFLSQKKQILQYLYTSIVMALLMNIDILLIKNIFDGEQAGYYAGISIIAKFLVFLWLSIETVYYPQLVKAKSFPISQIFKISVYYILMTLWALLFFYIFGEWILRTFKYWLQNYLDLVFPLLIYCGFVAYISIIVKTLIAFEKYTINYILLSIVWLLIVLVYTIWNSLSSVVYLFMLCAWLWLLTSIATMIISNSTHE